MTTAFWSIFARRLGAAARSSGSAFEAKILIQLPLAVPLLAQGGDALWTLRPLEIRPDRVPFGRIGRGDVLVDVQGTATRAGTDDQPAEGGDPCILVRVGERIAAHEEIKHRHVRPRNPGRDVDHRQLGVLHGDPRSGEDQERERLVNALARAARSRPSK